MCVSLLDDADLGGAQDAVSNLPAGLHDDLDRVVFLLGLCHSEHCFVECWVELLSLRIVLSHLESLQNFVHYICSHLLAFHVGCKLVFDILKVFRGFNGFHVGVL